MLVLSRKRNERIIIGDTIEVLVLTIQGRRKVRLQIFAPRDISVHRSEVHDQIGPKMVGAKAESDGVGGLVLTRAKDEKIIIGNSISIMIVDIRYDKVRIGIDAPRDVTVHRSEVYEAIQRESAPTAADE